MGEIYDPDKLYSKEYVLSVLRGSPKKIINYVRNLEEFECRNSEGQVYTCIKLPQFIYQNLIGRY